MIAGLADPIPEPISSATRPGWAYEPATITRHIQALKSLINAKFPDPPVLKGDGIIFVSDRNFFFMTSLAIRMTRRFTSLPIQWWHVGDPPLSAEWIGDVPNVEIRRIADISPSPRVQGGWQMKLAAILHSGWRRVLYLDSDAYLVGSPEHAFEVADLRNFVYWQDLDACEANIRWGGIGVDLVRGRKVPQVQGGHYCVDVKKSWRELLLSYWMDQHSDYYYRHVYADQDLLRIAWGITGAPYHVPQKAIWFPRAFVVGFPSIAPIIVHRCQGKVFPLTTEREKALWLPGEADYWALKERVAIDFKRTGHT